MFKEYQQRVDELFLQRLGQTNLDLSWNSPAEAEQHIRNVEALIQDLRVLKRRLRSDRQEKSAHIVTSLDSTVQDIDAIIMELALAKLQMGKRRHERASLQDSHTRR